MNYYGLEGSASLRPVVMWHRTVFSKRRRWKESGGNGVGSGSGASEPVQQKKKNVKR